MDRRSYSANMFDHGGAAGQFTVRKICAEEARHSVLAKLFLNIAMYESPFFAFYLLSMLK